MILGDRCGGQTRLATEPRKAIARNPPSVLHHTANGRRSDTGVVRDEKGTAMTLETYRVDFSTPWLSMHYRTRTKPSRGRWVVVFRFESDKPVRIRGKRFSSLSKARRFVRKLGVACARLIRYHAKDWSNP